MLGLWNGFLVAVLGIQPIIATLVLMIAGRGIAQLITDGQIITVANPLYAQLGGGFLLGLPVSVVLAAVLFALVGAVTRRTALGMFIEAVGDQPRAAARLAGIRARGITVAVYVFVAVCAVPRRADDQLQRQRRRRQQRGPVDRARRDPRRGDRRHARSPAGGTR